MQTNIKTKNKKKNIVTNTSKFRMHTYWNQQTASEGRKNQNRTNRQIIQYIWNQEQRSYTI